MKEKVINFKSKTDLKNSVNEAEARFHEQICDVAEALVGDNTRILSLAGPSCSGKTTASHLLCRELERMGKHAEAFSIDDFYRDHINEEPNPDYESIGAIDTEYLRECTDRLLGGKNAMMPVYDFVAGSRTSYREIRPGADDIFIFEGIQALYPQIVELFGGENTKKAFICVNDDAEINGVFFDRNELRLLRRLLRDFLFRGSDADFTLGLWKNVRKNEDENIFPYWDGCDFKISSYLEYETPIIGKALIPVLAEVANESENYQIAAHLVNKLSSLASVFADPNAVPDSSILREFIGKRSDGDVV